MKKLLFGAVALFLIASCAGNGTSEKASEDSADMTTDSLAQVESTNAADEKADLEAKRQEAAKKEKEAEEADFAKIQKLVKDFYQSSVIGCNTKTSRSHLSKYLTDKLISKLIKMNEYGGNEAATWYMRGDVQDCDERDKVLSVEKSNGNSVIVKFLDCGFTCKVRLDLVKEKDTWKINNFKFLSESSKSKFSEWNQYR